MKNSLFMALLTTLVATACPDKAQAQFMTGADLAAACDSKDTAAVYGCIHYVAGVIDYHVVMQSLGTAPTTEFCLPENLKVEEATVTVIDYLKRSPQHQDFIAAPAVTMALHESYPCAPVKPKPKPKKKK